MIRSREILKKHLNNQDAVPVIRRKRVPVQLGCHQAVHKSVKDTYAWFRMSYGKRFAYTTTPTMNFMTTFRSQHDSSSHTEYLGSRAGQTFCKKEEPYEMRLHADKANS